jgi:hypothetical protein
MDVFSPLDVTAESTSINMINALMKRKSINTIYLFAPEGYFTTREDMTIFKHVTSNFVKKMKDIISFPTSKYDAVIISCLPNDINLSLDKEAKKWHNTRPLVRKLTICFGD